MNNLCQFYTGRPSTVFKVFKSVDSNIYSQKWYNKIDTNIYTRLSYLKIKDVSYTASFKQKFSSPAS